MKINTDHERDILHSGASLQTASGVLILIHGRGAGAEDILNLAGELNLQNIAFIAPQADNNSWYPYSFLEPVVKNEPHLSNGLKKINDITDRLLATGFSSGKLFYLGFSQGACLALEFAARHPLRYGGIYALSGALIGKEQNSFNYEGSLKDTTIFIGCSDSDPHIPQERVLLSENVFRKMKADVTIKLYPGMGHTINQDELHFIRNSIQSKIEL